MILEPIKMVIEGALIGFVASIPLGPIGIICIQRTLNGNRNIGFISGLGAASADTIFALLAVFALSYVTSFIEDKMYWFQAIAGILLMLLGFSIFLKKVTRHSNKQTKISTTSHLNNYLSVLLLTLTNPSYIFIFITLFAAAGVSSGDGNLLNNLLLVAGVLIGASSWWFVLTWTINKLRKKFTLRSLWWINKISGSVIILIGALAIISMLFNLQLPSI